MILKKYSRKAAVAGFVMAVIGWGMLLVSQWAALAFGVLALAACIVGVGCGRGAVRNLSIAGVVASSVLIVDVLIVIGAVYYLMNM